MTELKANLFQMGFYINLHYKEDFKSNQKSEIEDITIRMVGLSRTVEQKSGLIVKKHQSFSLSEIDTNFIDLLKQSNVNMSNPFSESTTRDSIAEIAGELMDEFLKPNYVAQSDDEIWKKKRRR